MCHWSKEFQKIRRFFFGKSCSRDSWAPDCHPGSLIDLVKIDPASEDSVETICMISESYRTHRGFTGPMNFKKKGRFFFFRKSCSRDFGAPACHPITLIDFVNTALASKGSVETICMIWEGCRTHRAVTGPINFKKSRGFFRKIVLPGFWGPWLQSEHFN